MSDTETLAVYAAQADKYANLVDSEGVDKNLKTFTESLSAGSTALDWGCGVGNSTAYMRQHGIDVTSTDASPAFAEKAKELFGINVRVETFAELQDVALYDGIWASFSLLHAPKAEMPSHLSAAHRALKPKGRFAIGLKVGQGENRDEIGRFYAYYEEDELIGLLNQAGFTVTDQDRGETIGLDGQMWPWIVVHGHG